MTPRSGQAWELNCAVDGLIAAGRYAEALSLPARFSVVGKRDSASELLVQINLAEAEYNLGDWRAAWERLRGLDPLTAAFPIARAGLAQQRSWIAAHQGKPDEALHQWRRAELRDLPAAYHAEHFFTGTMALIGAGEVEAAGRCAEAGAQVATRPSSRRNALFIKAQVALAAGEIFLAESLCRAGAANPYRRQGGDGLLLWGELLERIGWRAQARSAYGLAVERDAQSESARTARERLQRALA